MEYPMAEPPEGVIAGENVPLENQEDQITETEIDTMVAKLKINPKYRRYNDETLREKVREVVE